jgi:hypothetical protein
MTMKMPFIARTHAAIAAVSVAGLLAGVAAPVAADDNTYVGCLTPGGTITRVGLGMPLGGSCPTNHIEISLGGAAAGTPPSVTRYETILKPSGVVSGNVFQLVADCGDGEEVLSGGVVVFPGSGGVVGRWQVNESGPSPLNDQWFATVTYLGNEPTSSTELRTYAYCTSDIDIELDVVE